MNCPACRTPNDETAVACASCGGSLMPHALSTLKPGALVAGRYEVLQFVGKGGMGVVLKARDRALDEIVALKVLRPDLAESDELDRRFRTEIKLARRVRHRNVCAIHEYGEDGALRYISMEFIQGTDLRRIVRATGGPLPHEAYQISEQAAEGLQAIHEAGIIHRDLKTSNIMRDSRGFVRLMDFGIAKDSSGDGGTTSTGQIIGTPEYMSPEQIRGDKIDYRSDIYSLGVVIFEVFTGRVPFHADTPIATILKHLQEPPPLDGPEAASLPRELLPVLARALAKEREARHATVGLLLEDLRRARAGSFPESAANAAAVTRPIAVPPGPPASSRVTAVPAANPTASSTPNTVGLRPDSAPVTRGAVGPPRPTPPSPPAPRSGSARRRALWWSAPLLLLAAGGVALVALRSPEPRPPQSATTVAAAPMASLPPPSTGPAASLSNRPPETSPPLPSAPTRAVTPAPRPASPARTGPSASAVAAPERTALAEQLLARGREALAKAEAGGGLEGYLEASRLFSKSLDADPAGQGAREGLARAIRGEERLKARLTQVSFEQTGTEVSGGPPNDLPPGLAAPPEGVVVKRAQPAGPRARIAIEIEPRLLKPGEPYVVRYFLQNESAGTLLLAGASIQNQIGGSGVAGGRVEPATATVAPGARSLLFEARDVWRQELGTAWSTTLRVFLTDGSVFSSRLSTQP
jgi:serine/threonine protein kinase